MKLKGRAASHEESELSAGSARCWRCQTLRGNSFVPQGYPDPAMPAPVSSLEQLKRQPRQPGEASFFYYDPHFQLNSAKVLPGEYFVSRDEMAIVTVLGSCIAACLWDRFMRIGGMNHFMLPDGDSSDVSGRYGSYAMELLINEMLKLGARRESMQAKIFGGAQVMANFTTMNVGERNTSFVTEYLQTERIPIVSEDVLDIYPRKVVFFHPRARPWSSAWHTPIPRHWCSRKSLAATRLRWRAIRRAARWICFEEG
jgi:chemotaxis protein CheD